MFHGNGFEGSHDSMLDPAGVGRYRTPGGRCRTRRFCGGTPSDGG
ncbi:hypothetical protein ACFFX0_26510 [Citricoccus parietis]|uniref:Uncharacterized protein n=1 Tax=Citricoccus parietis TaxID=592307 RepID=A0ABV5G6J5_9MICC